MSEQTAVAAPAVPAVPPPAINPKAPPAAADPKAPPAQPPAVDEKKAASLDGAAKRFALLAQRERDLVAKDKGVKARLAEIADKEASVTKRLESLDRWEKLKANAAHDPESVLSEFGLDYDKLTQHRLKGPNLPGIVDSKLAEFEKRQKEEREKAVAAEKSRADAEEKQAVETVQRQLVDFVRANASEYELIELYGAHASIYDQMREHFNETTKLLSYKEAADEVEKRLLEHASKIRSAKKFAAPPVPPPPGGEKRVEPAQRRTVSNDLTATTPAATSQAKALTDDDRLAKAVAAYEARRKK